MRYAACTWQYGTLMQLIGLIKLICPPLQTLTVCTGARWTAGIRVHSCNSWQKNVER